MFQKTSLLHFLGALLATTTSSVLSTKSYDSTDIFLLAVTGNVTDKVTQDNAFADVENTFLTKCGFPSKANVVNPGDEINTSNRFLAEEAALDTNEVKEKKNVNFLRGQQNHRELSGCPDWCANPPKRKVSYCEAACINGIVADPPARRLQLFSENARGLKTSFPFDPDACLKKMNNVLNPYNNKTPGANLVAYLTLAA